MRAIVACQLSCPLKGHTPLLTTEQKPIGAAYPLSIVATFFLNAFMRASIRRTI